MHPTNTILIVSTTIDVHYFLYLICYKYTHNMNTSTLVQNYLLNLAGCLIMIDKIINTYLFSILEVIVVV